MDNIENINDGRLGSALLEVTNGIKVPCAYYDPFGLCKMIECLYCDNCQFKITYKNGDAIATFDNIVYLKRLVENTNYEIVFYDRIPSIDEVYSYMFDEESKYKIIRKEDNCVMVDKTYKPKEYVKKK